MLWHFAESAIDLNLLWCPHQDTLRYFTVIHKGHAGQRHEVIAADVLYVAVCGTSTEVYAQVSTGLPCLRCTSPGTGFVMAFVITGKAGLG